MSLYESLQAASDYWTSIGFDEKRSAWEQAGFEIADRQESSANSRNALKAATKEFQTKPQPEQLASLGSLLKQYIKEINSLSSRSKAAENAFVQVYQVLGDAPDPAPVLQAAVQQYSTLQQVAELENENKRLASTVSELRGEMSGLRNQDVTIRRLEEQLAGYQEEMEQRVTAALAERSTELDGQVAERNAELDAVQKAAEERVAEVERKMEEMSRALDAGQTEMFNMRTKLDEDQAAMQAEHELVQEELKRAQESVDAANAERDRLASELESAKNAAAAASQAISADKEEKLNAMIRQRDTQLAAATERVAALADQVEKLQQSADKERQSHAAAQRDAQARVTELQAQLDARPTVQQVEALRKQIKTLQAVQYNTIDNEDGNGVDSSSRGVAGVDETSSLEALLMAKNSTLEGELSRVKVDLAEVRSKSQLLQERVEASEALVSQQKTLISKLEADLADARVAEPAILHDLSGGFQLPPAGSNALRHSTPTASPLPSTRNPLDSLTMATPPAQLTRGASLTTLGQQQQGQHHQPQQQPGGSVAAGGGAADDTAMLQIVCDQRDRFRKRVLELEKDIRDFQNQMDQQTNEILQLRSDNVKLYEKIRYTQSYYQSQERRGKRPADPERGGVVAGASGSASAAGLVHRTEDFEERYRQQYEASLNPFAEFSRSERNRGYADLNTVERVTLNTSKFVLTNKYTRMAVFFYAMGLHLLVVLSLNLYVSYTCPDTVGDGAGDGLLDATD